MLVEFERLRSMQPVPKDDLNYWKAKTERNYTKLIRIIREFLGSIMPHHSPPYSIYNYSALHINPEDYERVRQSLHPTDVGKNFFTADDSVPKGYCFIDVPNMCINDIYIDDEAHLSEYVEEEERNWRSSLKMEN